MTTDNVSAAFNEAAMVCNLEELRRQLAAMTEKADRLEALVREIPGLILSAGLDTKEGKQTKLAARFYV